MSRLLKINNIEADIDEQTAIGVTIQCYDVREPGKRKVNVTNSFTLPMTAKNLRIFGYPSNPQSIDNTVYDSLLCEYWVGNAQLIKDGKIRIDNVGDRLSCFIVDKNSIWDKLKELKFSDFVKEYIDYLNVGTFVDYYSLVDTYIYGTDTLLLPYYRGHLTTVEDTANIWLNYESSNGGHFCAYVKSIFAFIENKYGVNFGTNELFDKNIFLDDYAKSLYIPMRDIGVRSVYDSSGVSVGFTLDYIPVEPLALKDKTLYSFVNSFFQLFNVIIEEVDGVFRLYRWDDLLGSPIIDWSDRRNSGTSKFVPSIQNINQSNFIKYGSVYDGGSEFEGGKTLTCNNKNLELEADLLTIDASIPPFVVGYGGVAPDLSAEKSFETFQFFITGYESPEVLQKSTALIAVSFNDGVTSASYVKYLQYPSIYSVTNEYLLFDSIIKYPVFREVSAWLTTNDILNIRLFAQYYFDQLGGSYFINKIAGFNPALSTTPTKLELIKVSDNSPLTPPDAEYYTDGVGTGFTDGENDLFY